MKNEPTLSSDFAIDKLALSQFEIQHREDGIGIISPLRNMVIDYGADHAALEHASVEAPLAQ